MPRDQKIFVEREVQANFDKEWGVIKLDEHRYYKSVSGLGLKGVDFIAVHPSFGLVLIEMKNYKNGKDSIPVELSDLMVQKRKGTLKLINTIYKYYQRQFYFRLIIYIGWKFLYPKEWLIWLQAKEHLDNENFFFLGIIDH